MESKRLAVKLAQPTATGAKITFKSSNPRGLYVDKAGKLTAIMKGSYTVAIKINSVTVKKTIKVK